MIKRMSDQTNRQHSGFSAKTILVPGIVIGLLLLIAWAMLHFFEWKEVEINSDYSTKANKHQFLAAGRYLAELDYQIEEISGLDFFTELPPTDHTILTQFLPADLPQSHYERLTDWVNNGGHLISGVIDTSEDSPTKDFLKQFGVRIKVLDWDDDAYSADRFLEFSLPENSKPLSIDIGPAYRLIVNNNTTPSFGLKTNDYYHLVQLKKGHGRLTLITDNYLFSNWQIGNEDNALLLARIINSSESSTIWINDTFVSFQGIFSLIWEKGKWLVLLLTALLAVLLRRFSVRLGPLESFPDTQANNFSQHLLAMTRFHFRHGNSQHVLSTTREKIIKKVAAGKKFNNEEIVNKISRKTTLGQDQIRQALFDPANSNPALITTTAHLKLISAQLSRLHR